MVRTQIQLTEEQARALKRLAHSQHVSIAELIRGAVNDLIRKDVAPDFEEKRERALSIAGRFSSGQHDISEKHDRYIVEAIQE
ncbi:MAG: CopG family transcriptional regulator [bacterium]|nr:CopG family transcriptional regulator [bacterium]